MVLHSPNPTAELGWLLARPKSKLIVRYQSDVVRQAAAMRFYAPFLMRFLDKADMIFPTSHQYLESSETLKPFTDKCIVVPLGIVAEEYEEPDAEIVENVRRLYGAPYVFFCGVHRYYKGLPWLIRAANKIHARVVIAGDGPERAANMALAEQLGTNIVFPGALSHTELVAHLHACAVVAFPSCARSEAFGLSILEAHACGRPVVATRLGTGVEYVNEDDKTGINVPPCDAEALANAINELLSDEARQMAMGRYAHDRVRRLFNAETLARHEYELYEQVLTKH
jgi:glycosyltransferase involved in cell wall biosynthesis